MLNRFGLAIEIEVSRKSFCEIFNLQIKKTPQRPIDLAVLVFAPIEFSKVSGLNDPTAEAVFRGWRQAHRAPGQRRRFYWRPFPKHW